MAETIERLYRLTVDGQRAAHQLGELQRATDNLDKRFEAIGGSIKAFGVALAGAVSAGAIVTGIKGIIDTFDQLAKDAQKVGIAAEELQRLRYAADLSGVSSETLDKAIGRLSVGMTELADGTSDTAKALRLLGAQTGEDTITTLKRISDEFQKLPDGMEKTTLAIQLFGKSAGPDLIPLLNAGGDALQELADEADRFGGVVSGNVLKAAEAFNDNLSRLQRTAAGIGAQLTAGLLPALQTISQAMVDSARSGEGFRSTGHLIGELLMNLYGLGLKVAAVFEALGVIWEADKAIWDEPTRAFELMRKGIEDVNAVEARTNEKLAALRENFAKFTAEATKSDTEVKKSTESIDKLGRSSKTAADLAEEHRKAEEARWKQLIDSAKQQEVLNAALAATPLHLTAAEQAALKSAERYKELNDQAEAYLDNIEKEGEQLQILTDWLETGTDAQKAFAHAQLEAGSTAVASTETLKKQTDEIDILSAGFEGFFENLADGAADAEQVFKRTVQSIIAELLKLWARKYIVEAIFGVSGAKAATGLAFDEGKVLPFARGGVISQPFMFPMALAGEAGPEAILPLKRTASGDLGVQAQASPMNVTVNNYSDASVTTRRTGRNELEIIIEQTRAAIASDLRSGGNAVSRSLEQSYGIGRGAAAAF